MDVFDKFFQRYSYKFDKGYPNMDDPKDVLIIENILKELIVMEFEDRGEIPNEIEKLRVNINSGEAYNVQAIQKPTKSQETYWIYIDDVPPTSRPARLEVTKDLEAKGLFPKGKIGKFKKGGYYLETEDGTKLVVKGTGSKFTTSTLIKEGFVLIFYNALKENWNKAKEPFNSENMASLLTELNSIPGVYTGLGVKKLKGGKTAQQKVEEFLTLYDGESASKAAQVSLNDPLSAALRIFAQYPNGEPMRGDTFDRIKSSQAAKAGLQADKVNPGDIFLKVGDFTIPSADEVDITGLEELNKVFVNKWGDKPGLVAISLKQESAQGGKAKSFLQKFKPSEEQINKGIKSYNLSDDEMKYTDEELDKALDGYKSLIKQQVGDSKFIDLDIGANPPKTEQKIFTLAAYKALDYLFSYLEGLGATSPANGLVKMAAFGMSITDVNPTFFKVIGKGSGEIADVPERTPASATAQLTPGTKIKIVDKPTNGSILVYLEVDVLEGDEVYSQYELQLAARSNGGDQNTIEIQKAKKK